LRKKYVLCLTAYSNNNSGRIAVLLMVLLCCCFSYSYKFNRHLFFFSKLFLTCLLNMWFFTRLPSSLSWLSGLRSLYVVCLRHIVIQVVIFMESETPAKILRSLETPKSEVKAMKSFNYCYSSISPLQLISPFPQSPSNVIL